MLGDKLRSVGGLDNLGYAFLAEVEAAHLRTPSAAMGHFARSGTRRIVWKGGATTEREVLRGKGGWA